MPDSRGSAQPRGKDESGDQRRGNAGKGRGRGGSKGQTGGSKGGVGAARGARKSQGSSKGSSSKGSSKEGSHPRLITSSEGARKETALPAPKEAVGVEVKAMCLAPGKKQIDRELARQAQENKVAQERATFALEKQRRWVDTDSGCNGCNGCNLHCWQNLLFA